MADLTPAKIRTLKAFREKLAALPTSWRTKRLDALKPTAGLYVTVEDDPERFSATVRRESDESEVHGLPVLSRDGGVVLISEEEFEPAHDAWAFLAQKVGLSTIFPGRGGIINTVIQSIDQLMSRLGAQLTKTKTKKKSNSWLYWLIGGVGGAGLLYVATRKRKARKHA